MKSIILYGSSEDCCSSQNRLEEMTGQGEIRILGRSGAPSAEEERWPWIPLEEFGTQQADYWFLMSRETEKKDRDMLMERLGLSIEQIIPFAVFSLPDMTLELYESIRKRKITVFSNNCYGGLFSHAFRIENCSPFKNLWLYEHEYLQFLKNPEYYLSLKPKLKKMTLRKSQYDRLVYPVLSLGGLSIFCNHSRNPFKQIKKWNERASRVNPDDLIVVFQTSSRAFEDEFYRLDYPHKYCFTDYRSTHEETIYIPVEEGKDFANTLMNTVAGDNGIYSLTKMILGEKDIRL